ncbi:bucky ball-like [Periophthalmus magnuspinnatus]|uniref:bucky ball-like n=1 Tax=Periophthalmus magnuspinnatus TaxID=409849 RepID=UPI002436524A|nr:bucky ball-like [Periophthalmus magnuspinnatus]
MDAGTSTMNPPSAPGPSSSSGPGAAPGMSEEQTHHKPFFYVQPSHPFVPVQSAQWPVPVALPFNYSPYYGGYPGFGYGLPLLPHFQPTPYLDAPGFILPHTHHHLMDYRRMLNPQYYHSMAYHTRRLRYQQNVPTRDVTNSEVQTEPLPMSQRTSMQTLNQLETQNETSDLSTALSVQKDDHTLAQNDLAPVTANTTPPKGGFVIETEELRIECCASPAGLQVLHSHETSEMSRRFAQDVVHCSSIVQNGMLPDDNVQIMNTEGKKVTSPQPCPDILLVASPSGNEKSIELETTVTNNSKIQISSDVDAIRNEKNIKVIRLPFNAKYLAELRKIESSVWSTEDSLVPSPEFIMDSFNEALSGEVPSAHMLNTRDKTVQDEIVPIVHLPKTMSEELESIVPTFENPIVELPHKHIPKQACVYSKVDLKCSQNLLSDDSPVDGNQQDTSFESLPAYLPSSSWLTDFENVGYSKMPPTPQKLNKHIEGRSLIVPARRRKLDAEFKDATTIRKPKEKYKPKEKEDRRSLSDHECCVSRSYSENTFSYAAKGQRLCTRCSTKQKIYKTSTSPTQVSKRKMTPFQPWNEVILPTCDACKGHSDKRFARKGSSPEIRVERDGEMSENGCKWRWDESRKELKRPLASKQPNMEKCSGSYSKMRERGCPCGESQQTQWHRVYHCCHGNAIREVDENCTAATGPQQAHLAHRWQTEKPWKSAPGHNTEGFKNNLIRAQHLNLHRKSLPLSQGVHLKDTRC